jgi:Uma2 family endonuclease
MLSEIMFGHDDEPELVHRPITRREYHRMAEAGILRDDERVELLRGAIVPMSPIGNPHAWSVTWLVRLLARQLTDEWVVQPQCPLQLWDDSEPEPDAAVVPVGTFDRAASVCVLVVEVADSSLRKDMSVKAALYAEAAIPIYWLVDLNGREVVVFSKPMGGVYRRIDRHYPGEVLTLDGHPNVAVPIAEIVPPA